jgi:Rrf2 family protein
MRLSKKSEYAIRALTCLGAPTAPAVLSIHAIAGQANIPKKFLEQVLLALKKAGIVQSHRGKGGGYSLRMAAAGVTLGAIIRAVDGPLAPLPCTSAVSPAKCPDCLDMASCWLRGVMTEVKEGVGAVLEQITLVDLCRRAAESQRRHSRALIYEI